MIYIPLLVVGPGCLYDVSRWTAVGMIREMLVCLPTTDDAPLGPEPENDN